MSDTSAVSITLDPDTRFQTMSGWEVTATMPDRPGRPAWMPYREEMLDRLVNEVGINRYRLELRAGAETNSGLPRRFFAGQIPRQPFRDTWETTVNDNDDPFSINPDGFDFAEMDWQVEHTILPIRERLNRRGERLLINLCYVNFQAPGLHADPEEYAELVLAAHLHLRDKYGITPDMLEVVLEPDLHSRGWTGAMMGRAMVATARRLQAAGFSPSFVVPSVTSMQNTLPFMEDIETIPGAMEHVDEIAYHRYSGTGPDILRRISAYADRRGLRVSMLEYWFGDATYHILHEDLTLGNNAAWQGRPDVASLDAERWGTRGVPPKPDVRYNLQYFRYVRHGAVRIGADSDRPGQFAPVAFINADGRHVVIVKASAGGRLKVGGLPPGQYQISYAVQRGSAILPALVMPDAGGYVSTEIPAEGVLTIAAQ